MRRLLMAALAALAVAPMALGAQATRDSLLLRRLNAGNEIEVMRVVNELREREGRILAELSATSLANADARRNLEEQLARVSREAFTVMSLIESRCIEERMTAPAGYLGLNITSEIEVHDRSYTVARSIINSVDPGSPAERAGVLSGDRLLAIGGRDARERLPELGGILEPGRRVPVKVERGGAEREFVVVAAPRPVKAQAAGCPQFERALQPLRMSGAARVWVQDSTDAQGTRRVYVYSTSPAEVVPTGQGGTAVRVPYAPARPGQATNAPPAAAAGGGTSPAAPPTAPTAPTAPVTPATPAVASSPGVFVFGPSSTSSVSFFAGAQFRALDDDWRDVLSLRANQHGVLVTDVAAGSAAAQSGLKVGDVVTDVSGTAATSPLVLSRMLGLSEESHATLKVIRKRQPLSVTLRWGSAPR